MRGGAPAPPSPFENAALYDLLFEDLDFDRAFYLGLAREAGGPVLEVACGTGRILLPCLAAGTDIEGLDRSRPMLERLEQKARERRLAARVHEADMRSFSLARRFALVFIAFNGFVHCLTTADQLACLRCCRAHLEPGGRLTLHTFFPGSAVLAGPQGVPVLEHEAKHPRSGLPVRIYDTRTLDSVAQVQHSEMEIQELDAAGKVIASHRSATDMRWTGQPEMELLLDAAGFSRSRIEGGFAGELLDGVGGTMIVSAWRD